MDLFPDGGFVRLQNRETRRYVHADADWYGVSLRWLSAAPVQTLDAVWRVERLTVPAELGGGVFILLQNAAYGRYLSFSPLQTLAGHRGHRVVQADRDEPPNNVPDAYLWWWKVHRVRRNQDYVRLRYADTIYYLRANGKYLTRNSGVTVGRRSLTTMMQWMVHPIPASPVPLPIPIPVASSQRQKGGRRGQEVYQLPGRTIRHVRASDEGEFDPNHHNWSVLPTFDNSVMGLRVQLGLLQGDWNGDILDFTLCMRPGLHGRLMPLVTNLPRSMDHMVVVVLRTESPAAAELMYPQIAEPAQ